MKKRKVRVAVAQIRYFDYSRKDNVDKIKKYIYLASLKGADIICSPESCIHKTDYLQVSHKLVKEIQESCKDNKIWCIVTDSFIENRKSYKIALLINRKGKIKSKYKKINLYDDFVNPGRKIDIAETDFGKIGIVVCWDIAFPSLFYKMKQAGVKIVFCPSKWAYEEKAYRNRPKAHELRLLKSMLMSRAFENLYFVALANPVVPKRKDMIAYSAIASPHKIIDEIEDKEGLIIADLDLSEIKKWKKLYPGKSRKYSG